MTPTFDDLSTRILALVIAGERSVNRIADTFGVDRLVVSRRLHTLKDEGLIDSNPRARGTLRALVTAHPIGQWGQS